MKKFFTLLLAGVAILNIGCSDDDGPAKEAPTYKITVSNNGNGRGEARIDDELIAKSEEGETISITAKPDEDYKFVKWTVVSGGVTLSSETANPATFTMPANDIEIMAEFESAIVLYKVGDYYPDPAVVYKDGVATSGTEAEGVVFWLDPTHKDYDPAAKRGTKGKIVSLNSGNEMPFNEMYYINNPDGAGVIINPTTLAFDYEDGQENMLKVKAITAVDWTFYFPIFKWSDDQGEGWYIPARNELEYLYCAYNGDAEFTTWGNNTQSASAVNTTAQASFAKKITDAGGDGFSTNGDSFTSYLWSSTEYFHETSVGNVGGQYAYIVSFLTSRCSTLNRNGASGVDEKFPDVRVIKVFTRAE